MWSWGLSWRALCRGWELAWLSRLELSHTAVQQCGGRRYSCCSVAHSAPTGQGTLSPDTVEACVCVAVL